jgi:hypothetical protein
MAPNAPTYEYEPVSKEDDDDESEEGGVSKTTTAPLPLSALSKATSFALKYPRALAITFLMASMLVYTFS